jgi:hypothetical protein
MLAMAAVGALSGPFTAGCGDGEDEGSMKPPPVARPQDFPSAGGKTLAQLRREVGQSGPVLSPSVSQFEPGPNRFGFGLFDRARAQIGDAAAAVYVAPMGGGPARGPFPARYESLEVKPRFQSRTVSADPDSAKSVYVADLDFDRPGDYQVLGLVRLDNRLVAAAPAGPPVRVMQDSRVPEVGEPAPRTSTPTEASVGGDIDQIETRMPPDSMHDVDFAKVVGRRPAVLLFSTPQLCQSRVCGPVVDIAEQVKAEGGEKVAFIHMEIYKENTVEKGFRPQVVRWRLPTEPWLFAVDRRGRVAARMEGAFSARELKRAVAAAERGARPAPR